MVDGERNFRVEAVADQDSSRRGRRRGRRPGAGAACARGGRRGDGGSGRGRVRPGRHSQRAARTPNAAGTRTETNQRPRRDGYSRDRRVLGRFTQRALPP